MSSGRSQREVVSGSTHRQGDRGGAPADKRVPGSRVHLLEHTEKTQELRRVAFVMLLTAQKILVELATLSA